MQTKFIVFFGFLIGFLLLLVTNVITLLTYSVYLYVSADEFRPFYGIMGIVVVYLIEVSLLVPFGSLPSGRAARIVFVWGPVIVGWFVAYYVNMLGLFVGLMVSATCVGYNMMVTLNRPKRIHLWRG
jgi:hypothetical protein